MKCPNCGDCARGSRPSWDERRRKYLTKASCLHCARQHEFTADWDYFRPFVMLGVPTYTAACHTSYEETFAIAPMQSAGTVDDSPARKCRGRHPMSHSDPNLLVHCVFSTKNRRDLIPKDLHETLAKYFIGIGKGHNVPVLCAGGTENHAHLLIALPAAISLAKAVQIFKANSSRWLGEHGFDFAWARRLQSV